MPRPDLEARSLEAALSKPCVYKPHPQNRGEGVVRRPPLLTSSVQVQLLNLACDRIAPDPKPLGRFHFPAAREVQRLANHRSFKAAREFVHDISGILAQ